jgi:Xaa-Pro aminopeptidase
VAFAAGALADGYVGEVGRTWPVGEVVGAEALYRRSNELWERLIDACRPGAPAGDLLAVYDAAGEAPPPIPVAHGLGLGFDPPVISPDLPRTSAAERLDPGTVLAVTAYVWEPGVGAVFTRDAVLIGDDGPEVLTGSPSWAQSVSS